MGCRTHARTHTHAHTHTHALPHTHTHTLALCTALNLVSCESHTCCWCTQIRLGCLASELVYSNVCQNFVETYQVLRLSCRPSESVWGSATLREPQGSLTTFLSARAGASCRPTGTGTSAAGRSRKRGAAARVDGSGANGDFVFIRMELCDGGSAEDALRLMEAGVVEWEARDAASHRDRDGGRYGMVESKGDDDSGARVGAGTAVRAKKGRGKAPVPAPTPVASPDAAGVDPGVDVLLPWTFQMAMSLLACKSRLDMVHSDVKLLNFMLVSSEKAAPRQPLR